MNETELNDATAPRSVGQPLACSAWQDITTAPKEKKAILVWLDETKSPALVCWDENVRPLPGWVHFHSYNQRLLRAPTLWMHYPEPNV